jgi:hypothetical protein
MNNKLVFFWLIKDKWILNIYCVIGSEYRVVEEEERVFDHMSNMNISLKKAYGLVGELTIWESIWLGTRYSFKMNETCMLRCPS